MTTSWDAGLQMFHLSARLAFPLGSCFYLSLSSSLCLAGSWVTLEWSILAVTVSWALGALELTFWWTGLWGDSAFCPGCFPGADLLHVLPELVPKYSTQAAAS